MYCFINLDRTQVQQNNQGLLYDIVYIILDAELTPLTSAIVQNIYCKN